MHQMRLIQDQSAESSPAFPHSRFLPPSTDRRQPFPHATFALAPLSSACALAILSRRTWPINITRNADESKPFSNDTCSRNLPPIPSLWSFQLLLRLEYDTVSRLNPRCSDVISRELFRPAKPDASRAERRRTLHRSDEKLESLESLFHYWRSKLEGPVTARAAPNGSRRASTSVPNRAPEENTLWKGPGNPEEVLDGLEVANKYIAMRKASLERRFGKMVWEGGGGESPEGTPPKRDPRLAPGAVAKLPLFLVYPPPCPGETIERFIFEPRYRLLVSLPCPLYV